MQNKSYIYSFLLIAHAGLGILLFLIPFSGILYSLLIMLFGFILIVKNQNKNNEVLLVCSYIVGSEVLIRMTGGNFLNDLAKYQLLIFTGLGFLYSGFSKNALAYWLYLLLLLPGIIVSTTTLDVGTDMRKAIAFNIVGPVALGVMAIYCYRRSISFSQLLKMVALAALPIVSMSVYLFLYTPSVRDVVTGTSSNFETSGGFGPNQVSTILGLGMFLFAVLSLFASRSKLLLLAHLGLLAVVSFRGVVTFSRGGVITGVAMIIILLAVLFQKSNAKMRGRILVVAVVAALFGLGIWSYSSFQTSGMIDKRYANQDAAGREKADALGGREQIAQTELDMFLENPILGIGVGKNKEYREQLTGIEAASHNEITRLLAEHGLFGVTALAILLFTPLVLALDNKQHLFLLSFFVFWLLTINHAAMRTAAPAFIYALSLLKIHGIEKPAVHRE